jgi:hypothetical protein
MGWGGEEASVVGPHAADNAVCELAFVGASGFFLGLAFGAFAGHGPSWWLRAWVTEMT